MITDYNDTEGVGEMRKPTDFEMEHYCVYPIEDTDEYRIKEIETMTEKMTAHEVLIYKAIDKKKKEIYDGLKNEYEFKWSDWQEHLPCFSPETDPCIVSMMKVEVCEKETGDLIWQETIKTSDLVEMELVSKTLITYTDIQLRAYGAATAHKETRCQQ